MSSLSSPPPSSFSSMLCLRKKRQRNNFFQCYYFMAILVCYITLFSSSNNNNNNNIVVFAQSTGGTSGETPKPGCGDWERTAKDEIARFKQAPSPCRVECNKVRRLDTQILFICSKVSVSSETTTNSKFL